MKNIYFAILFSIVYFLFSANFASAVQCAIPHSYTYPNPNPPPANITQIFSHPELANSIVPCGQFPDCQCEISDLFILVKNIYIFIIWYIATPFAGLLIVLGGLLLLLSGASSKLHDLGKTMLWGAAWGIALIFGAYLIVSTVLMVLGYQGAWNIF